MMAKVYWLDTNVLITARNGPFRFSINPGFWSFIDAQVKAGRIRAPKMVYREILHYEGANDELTKWVKNRRNSGLFVDEDGPVQKAMTEVSDHVMKTYEEHHAAEFLRGADPWLVAHAKVSSAVVVTFEKRQPGASRVKIPNVCAELGIRFVDPYDMLEELEAAFTIKKKGSK